MGKAVKHSLRYTTVVLLLVILLAPLPSSGASPQELLQVGTGAFDDGFYPVAEAQFREFLQAYPQHPHVLDVMYLLGRALYEQKKYAEAKEIFISLITSQKVFQPIDAAYFWLGRSCEKLDEIFNAQSNLLTIATKYPHSPWYQSSLFLLGKISVQEGQYKRAEMYLKKLFQDRSISPALSSSTKFWLGLTLYEQGKYKETENLLRESALQETLLEEALYWLGETHIKLKKYKKGAVVFRALLDHFPQSSFTAHALYGESLCLYMSERKEEALKGLLTLEKDFPHTALLPHVLSFIGEIYIDLDKPQVAIEVFKEFLNRFPQDQRRVKILLNLVWCYLKRGNLAQAREITYDIMELSSGGSEKALAQYILAELNTFEGNCQEEAMPYWFNLLNTSLYRQEALFKIAVCSFQESKIKESLVNIDLLRLEYPNFYKMDEALWIQGESYRALGNISEANKAYQRVIKEYKRSSWYPWTIYRMIMFLLKEKNMRGAERYFDILYKKFSNYELSYKTALTLGIQKAEAVEYESSLNYLQIAQRSPDNTVVKNALCWQGGIYLNLKEYQKAWDAYQKVIAENPSSNDVLTAMAYLELGNIKHLVQDHKKAKEAYKMAIEVADDDIFKENVKLLLKELKEAKRGGT